VNFLYLAMLVGLAFTTSCSSESTASADVVARVNGKESRRPTWKSSFRTGSVTRTAPAPEEAQNVKLEILTS